MPGSQPSPEDKPVDPRRRPPSHDDARSVEALIERMRAGDRSAISEFVLAYAPLIRNRFRQRIAPEMRCFFDSMDLVSTVARRFDKHASSYGVDFQSPEELFRLIFRIARMSCAEKMRLCSRLNRVEGPDSEVARMMASRLRGESSRGAIRHAFDLEDILSKLGNDEDSNFVRLWVDDHTFREIGLAMSISESAAKQRWNRLRPRLHEILSVMAEA